MEQSNELKILIEETIDCFQKIEFQEIDERFVRDAWASGFSECDDYDPSSELLLPHDDITAIGELCNVCESWTTWPAHNNEELKNRNVVGQGDVLLDTTNSTEENLFTVLMNSGISLQNVVSFVFIFCTKATKPASMLHEKEIGLCFARFYFMLLAVPASTAYRVYHPNVFQVAVDCLKLPKEKLSSKRCNSNSSYRGDCDTPSKRRRRNTFESDAPSEPDHLSDFSEIQEPQAGENEFQYKECTKIISFISFALLSLVELLGKFSLKRDQDIVEHTIQQLVECSACETVHTNLQFNLCPTDIGKLKNKYGVPFVVTCLAFKALCVICEPKHGNENHNYLKVLKHLAQNILCSNARSNHSVARKYTVVKDNSAAFVAFNMKKNPERYVKSTRTLLQQLCVKVQDKSDVRVKIANCIILILDSFPDKHYYDMLDWFQRLVLNVKVQSRVFGLEIFAQILNQFIDTNSQRWNSPSVLGMIQSLIFRCNDKATSVRTKALTVLSNNLKFILKSLKRVATKETQCDTSSGRNQTFCNLPIENYRETIDDIVRMLHRRTEDDKVYVRKAALHAMEKVISLDITYLNLCNLKAFERAAEDASVSIRKQILQSLTVILETYMSIDTVHEIWLETVLPLVLDPEASVQEKCLEVLESVIFHRLDSRNDDHAWKIIMHLTAHKQQYLQRYLEKAVFMLIRSERISPKFASSLKPHIGSSKDPAVWLLLSLIVPHVRIKNPSDITDYFNQHDENISIPTMNNVLKVISHTAKCADETKLRQIQEKLEHQLKTFSCRHQLISRAVEALSSIYSVLFEKENICPPSFSGFCEQLMKDCERYLSAVFLQESPEFVDSEHDIVSRLFTLGECSQYVPSAVPKNSYLLLQSIIASHPDSDYNFNHSSSSPPNQMSTMKIKAHAFITLGKLCLQNEDLAKKCLPVFIKELVTSEHCVIRCNVIIILVDMCIRFTSLVDPYIPNITFCLKDPSCIVRRQTLTLLTQLLQEDYIKMKGSMFFRMLSSVMDDDPDIKKDAEYILGHQLLQRQPAIFSHHFVESIFHFNNYKYHMIYNNFFGSNEEEKLFSLRGDHYKNKRMALYKFMLDHMKDEEKLGLNLKLCQEILSPVVEEIIPLDESGENLVKDCLAVLSCEEIKLSSLTSSAQDEAEDGDSAAFLARANKNILSQVVKRKVIENIVPIIVALKRIFSEKKSPLLKALMAFFRELAKDYKNELKEIMAAEKSVAKEIECDIRCFEKQQEADKNRRERNSSDSESFRLCVRNSRASSERHLVRRQSTLQVIRENSVVSPSESHNTTLSLSNSETPVKKHARPEVHVRRLVSCLPTSEIDQDCLPCSSGLQLVPSVSSEQHTASSDSHSHTHLPENQEASSSERLSNYPVSGSKDVNNDPSFSDVQCVSSVSEHQDADIHSSSKKHETGVFHSQPICHPTDFDVTGESFSASSPSSEMQNDGVQPHNLCDNLKENSGESEMHRRTHNTSPNKSNRGKSCGTATVNKENSEVAGAENIEDNLCDIGNCPNSTSSPNVPSISNNPHSEVPQGNTTYVNSPLGSRSPVIVLRKLEKNKLTQICSKLANKQDYSAQKQTSEIVSAGEKPCSSGRIISKSNAIASLKTLVTHSNVQTRNISSGQELNVENMTEPLEHSFVKSIHYTKCSDHSTSNVSHQLQSVSKPSDEQTSAVISKMKNPVICLQKLTPIELSCYKTCLYNQPSTVRHTQKKTLAEMQKRITMGCPVKLSKNINSERTRSHKIDQFKEFHIKKNCHLPVAANKLKTHGASGFFEQTNLVICCETSGDNQNKQTEKSEEINNTKCASGSKHSRVQNSFLGKNINSVCLDKLETAAKISDGHDSDVNEACTIHTCLTNCSVCRIKLDNVIHSTHHIETCSTLPRASKNTVLQANISSEHTPHRNIPLVNNLCKSTSPKKAL